MFWQIFLIFCVACPFTYANGEMITMVGEERFPYTIDSTSEFLNAVVCEAFRTMLPNVLNIDLMSNEKAYQQALEGVSMAFIGATPQKNPELIFGKEIIGWRGDAFFVKKNDSWEYQGEKSLKGKRVGCVPTENGVDIYSEAITKAGGIPAPSTGIGDSVATVQALLRGNVSIILDDFNAVETVSKELRVSHQIRFAGFLNPPEALYIGFSPKIKNAQQLADTWDQGLQKLRASGDLKMILQDRGLNKSIDLFFNVEASQSKQSDH
jgi:polar amino acid transport system substrate-binding protein